MSEKLSAGSLGKIIVFQEKTMRRIWHNEE